MYVIAARRADVGWYIGSDTGRMSGANEMTSVTIELPDETYRQLHELAEARGMSPEALMESSVSAALVAHHTEARFRAFASLGDSARATKILDRLDRAEPPAP
jgi:Ribbon-helix-helix protein, copG family